MSYTRTAAGDTELTSRALPLSIPTRRLLGMIEGDETLESITAKARFGDIERMLRELVERGLLQSSEAPHSNPDKTPLATSPPARTTESPVKHSPEQLQAVRRLAIRFLLDNLGPGGERWALRIERTRDANELEPVLHEVRAILLDLRGESLAEKFYESVIVASFGKTG